MVSPSVIETTCARDGFSNSPAWSEDEMVARIKNRKGVNTLVTSKGGPGNVSTFYLPLKPPIRSALTV
jgi:hypothetical protein